MVGLLMVYIRLMVDTMRRRISNGGFNRPLTSRRLGRRSAFHGWWFCIPSLCHGKRRWKEVSTSINWVPWRLGRLAILFNHPRYYWNTTGLLQNNHDLQCFCWEGGKPDSWFMSTYEVKVDRILSEVSGVIMSYHTLILPISYQLIQSHLWSILDCLRIHLDVQGANWCPSGCWSIHSSRSWYSLQTYREICEQSVSWRLPWPFLCVCVSWYLKYRYGRDFCFWENSKGRLWQWKRYVFLLVLLCWLSNDGQHQETLHTRIPNLPMH